MQLEQEEGGPVSENSDSTTKVINIKPYKKTGSYQTNESVAETDTKVVKINNMSVYSHDGMSS